MQENVDVVHTNGKPLMRTPLGVRTEQNNSSPANLEETRTAPLWSAMQPIPAAEMNKKEEEEEAITRELLIKTIEETRALKTHLREDRSAARVDRDAFQSTLDASSEQAAKAKGFQDKFAAEVQDIKRRVENVKMTSAVRAYEASKPVDVPPKTPPKGPHVAKNGAKSTKKRAVKSFKAHANEKAVAKQVLRRHEAAAADLSGVQPAMMAMAFGVMALGMYAAMVMM